MHRSLLTTALAVAVVVVIAWQAGCDSANLPSVPSVGDIKQKVDNSVEAVRQSADMAGNIELQLDEDVKTSGCYAALYLQTGGRSNVLQITSYNSPAGESFPSFFMRSRVSEQKVGKLIDQQLTAQIYVQQNPKGSIWHSPEGEPAQVSVTSADDSSIGGLFVAYLINSETGERKQVTGKFNGSVVQPAK